MYQNSLRHKLFGLRALLSVIFTTLMLGGCSPSLQPEASSKSQANSAFYPALTKARLEQHWDTIENEELENYLKEIVQDLKSSSQSLELVLYKSDSNFALFAPPRSLFLSSALLLALKNESELAFVLAHEVAHMELNHRVEARADKLRITNEYPIQQELEADALALKKIAQAGYQPFSALDALESLSSRGKTNELERRSDALASKLAVYTGLLKRPEGRSRYRRAQSLLQSL